MVKARVSLAVCYVYSTALMLGAVEGDEAVVRLLTEAGADPDIRDQAGLRATDHALRNNHPQ